MQIRIKQGAFEINAVVRFVMFETMPADLIAQGKQKVILPVVARSEQRSSLGNQFLISGDILSGHGQVLLGVGNQIHDVDRRFSRLGQFDLAIVSSGDQRRIDQRGERNGSELHVVA